MYICVYVISKGALFNPWVLFRVSILVVPGEQIHVTSHVTNHWPLQHEHVMGVVPGIKRPVEDTFVSAFCSHFWDQISYLALQWPFFIVVVMVLMMAPRWLSLLKESIMLLLKLLSCKFSLFEVCIIALDWSTVSI